VHDAADLSTRELGFRWSTQAVEEP
jgi:hypothetical protein